MGKWTHKNFEGKQINEKILHFCKPSKKQLVIEILKIILPTLFIFIVFITLALSKVISSGLTATLSIVLFVLAGLSIGYKIYRAKNNYLYITSKRILFHGMKGLFKDYVKKVAYENIVNVNYFTESVIGKIFGYGTLEIQTAHSGLGDIIIYHVENGKMLTHYIDKIISLRNDEERENFAEFDENYFK